MANEEAQVETTTGSNTAEQVTATPDVNVSEDEKTTTEPVVEEEVKVEPDLKVALKQERERRQQLEAHLNDPDFVYQLAQQHGLTQEEAEEMADDIAEQQAAAPQPRGVRQPQVSVDQLVDERLEIREDYKEAVSILPEVMKDPALSAWAASLVGPGPKRGGMSHVDAVKLIQTKRAEWSKQGVQQGAQIARETENAKEGATTAVPTSQTPGGNAELEDIRERMQSRDTRVQAKAYEEFQLYKMRHPDYKKATK